MRAAGGRRRDSAFAQLLESDTLNKTSRDCWDYLTMVSLVLGGFKVEIPVYPLELETNAIIRFGLVSIVS